LRRFLRPIVIVVASLGLALGAGVGLAAPAAADDASFTASITSALPIMSGASYTLTFGGEKTTDSSITSVEFDNPVSEDLASDSSACTGLAAGTPPDGPGTGTAAWSCSFEPEGGFESGNAYNIKIVEQNADGTVDQHFLSYDVIDSDNPPTPPPAPSTDGSTGYVNRTYAFNPSTGVTVTGTPTAGGAYAGLEVETVGEGNSLYADCVGPGTDGGSTNDGTTDRFNGVAAGTNYCTAPLDAPQDSTESDGGEFYSQLFEVESVEGNSDKTSLNGTTGEYFTVFASPTISTAVAAGGTQVLVSGVGAIFGTDAPVDVFDGSGTQLCEATPVDDDAGDWSCTTPDLGIGTHQLFAAVKDLGAGNDDCDGECDDVYYVDGAYSKLSAPITAIFTSPAPTTGGSGTGDTTPDWSFTIGGDLTDVHPGDTLDISGTGLPPGTSLDTILHSVPTDLGSVVAAADGSFDQTVTIPADTELGDHTILVTASGLGIVTTTKQQAITVTAVPAAAGSSGSGKPDVTTKPTATHGAGVGASGTGIAPNILTRALTPIADVAVHPNKIISALEIGLVLLLLAVLPAHLLNATIAEQSDRFERRFPKWRTPRWLAALVGWFRSAPVAGGLVVTLATAILFGFADPTFGFTLASLRLILACGIALFLVGYVANAITGVIARVQWNIVAAVSTRPYGLILTIVGVLISRLLHFSPGFLIGLILGLTIQGKSAAGFAWRTVVVRSSIVLIMAIAAWIGYSTLTLGGNEGGTFGSALLVETLVAITTEGVVALLVELLPLRFLEGERVYAHSKVLWGIFYVLTLVVFVLAVVPWEGNWDALGSSLWIWIVVLAAFAAVCVGIYIYFRRFAKPLEEDPSSEKVALGETVAGDRS
jgi:hypothetical protein